MFTELDKSWDTALLRQLRGAPRLLASYLAHRNLAVRGSVRRGRIQATVPILWLLSAVFLWTQKDLVAGAMNWIDTGRWFLAGILVVVSISLTLRQRAALQAEHKHTWLAALPVAERIGRCENYFYRGLPAAWLLASLWVVLWTAGSIALLEGLKIATLSSLVWNLSAASIVGAGLGMVMPLPKPEALTPGSRYVPHRKSGGTAPISPSLRGLGIWPIRQMFASARPKTVSRGSMLILLAMPLGASADSAMLIVGLCAVLALLWLLATGVTKVAVASRHWLAPLPMTEAVRLRALCVPSVAFAAVGGLLEAWLLWLLQVDVVRASAYAVITWTVAAIFGATGCALSLAHSRVGRS